METLLDLIFAIVQSGTDKQRDELAEAWRDWEVRYHRQRELLNKFSTLTRVLAAKLDRELELYDLRQHRAEMKELFDRVCDPHDWKADVSGRRVMLTEADAERMKEAVTYFTGTVPTVSLFDTGPYANIYNVSFTGYRNGPCGP